jgi:hypothetical protein
VTYKTGFWIRFIVSYTFTRFGTTGNYSAIAILHTFHLTVAHALGFSVFTSRILATDLSQSHCNFKSHMKCSWHSLIPFLPFLLSHRRLPAISITRPNSPLTTVLYFTLSLLLTTPSTLLLLLTDQSTRSLTCHTCFLCGLRCAFCAWSVPRGYERIREWELTGLEFRSSKGTAVWPEEELEDLVCGVMCCGTSILGVCNLVRFLQFLCYKSVARKRIVKTSGNILRGLA